MDGLPLGWDRLTREMDRLLHEAIRLPHGAKHPGPSWIIRPAGQTVRPGSATV
jgi:hypothetical protein